MPRVFKPLTAYERAAAELRSKQRAAVMNQTDVDRIVHAKAAIAGRADRPQGFLTRHAFPKQTQLIPREDRTTLSIPRVYIPRVRGERHKNALVKLREYSGVSRSDR